MYFERKGTVDGEKWETYLISTEDERKFIQKKEMSEREIDNALDDFEDGMNWLVEEDGILYEVVDSEKYTIKRKAYRK